MNAPKRRKEWQEFKDWCQQRKLKAYPAHPWTVSAYMVWLDANRRYRTLTKRLDVISRVHLRDCLASPDQNPLVKRTIEAIEERRTNGTQSNSTFDGSDMIQPAKKPVQSDNAKPARRSLRQSPPLVSRSPQLEA